MAEADDLARFTVLAPRPIERILAGASLAGGDEGVLAAAIAVGRATGASVCAVHAVEPPLDGWASGAAPESLSDARSRLSAQVERLAAPGAVRCASEVAAGPAHRVLDDEARRSAPALIVVGATARQGGTLLGSTAERIVRKASVPVLVVRGSLALPPRLVIAPVDLSNLSAGGFHCGLGVVSRLAGEEPVRVVALFAIGYLDPLSHEMRRRRWSLDEMTALARERLESFVAAHRPEAPLAVDSRVVLGPAREEIVGAARAEGADLVVMSTHGHGGFERLVVGSVAATVVREAPCSVLLVPPTAAFGDAIAEAVLSQTAPCKNASAP